MAELIQYSKICLEDLDLGDGTREVRLQDGSLHTLNRISGILSLVRTTQLTATNGTTTLTATGLIPLGARVHDVTIKILTALGTSNGLSSIMIGDSITLDRWGSGIGVTQNTETSQADFTVQEMVVYSSSQNVLITGNANYNGTGI